MIRKGRGRSAVLMVALMVAGCDRGSDTAFLDKQEVADSPAARDLDALALETGALPDRNQIDPAGRYGRRYEGGTDRLCLIPDDQKRGRYRFGAETRIGRDEYCRGAGSAKLSADKLVLRFNGAGRDCLIVARYEGDKIVLPGALDLSCTALCSSRGSFAGVSFPRRDRDAAAASKMADQDGNPLCR